MVVDQLAAQFGSIWEKSRKWDALSAKCGAVLLIKPMSFMNRSGYPLLAVAQFFKIQPEEILVVLDDLALPLGRLRLREGGGPGGHNGLESIIMQFGTEEISRLRVGIGEAPGAVLLGGSGIAWGIAGLWGHEAASFLVGGGGSTPRLSPYRDTR